MNTSDIIRDLKYQLLNQGNAFSLGVFKEFKCMSDTKRDQKMVGDFSSYHQNVVKLWVPPYVDMVNGTLTGICWKLGALPGVMVQLESPKVNYLLILHFNW